MKDFRSLEQKIIQLVQESNRNTELRKKESNVGRPTGENKLAKQGQIKTKIIDEDSEYGMARNELETAKRAIDRLNAKMGKGEGELEAWVQSKITKASDYLDTVADYIESGSVKEEIIDEKARRIHVHHKGDVAHVKDLNGNIIASYNRREHGDNYLRRANAHLGKVYEDSVASVSTKDSPKEQPESKKKTNKSIDKDLMEPGKIKGGKTEVDLEPTTDDRDDEGKKDTDKSKVATRKANREAGVKEETMNTTKNFGLPADLIATVAEALKGNQKKIDKNHNGKIDGQDFKILRKEEVVDEERMSKGRRDALARKTSFTADPPRRLEKPEPKETKSDKMKAYRADRDKHMEEEAEQIDELSKKTLGNYAHAGVRDIASRQYALGKGDKSNTGKLMNRRKGVDKAISKLSKEEVESVDEGNPINKAKKNAAVAAVGAKNRDDHYLDRMNPKVADKIRGREKMSGKDRQWYEEVEFSEAELAHINAILESDDFNYANSKDHKPLSNWPKVHAAIHNDYTDSGGGGTEGEKKELGKTPIHPKYHAAHDEAEANPKKMKKAINIHYGHDVSRDD